MRLQKFLAQAGVSSRRKAEALIASGAVRVNGVAVTTLGTSVNASKDRVDVDGRRVVPETPIYRLLLKPRACLATLAKSGAGRPTLARYVRDAEPGLQVVAPLDFPAEGVVLLTTDGELAQAMGKRGRVPMTYHLKLQGMVGEDVIMRLARGWRWEGRPVKPVTHRSARGDRKEHLDRDGRAGVAAARAQGGGRPDPAFAAEDFARAPGRAVVRGPRRWAAGAI